MGSQVICGVTVWGKQAFTLKAAPCTDTEKTRASGHCVNQANEFSLSDAQRQVGLELMTAIASELVAAL